LTVANTVTDGIVAKILPSVRHMTQQLRRYGRWAPFASHVWNCPPL